MFKGEQGWDSRRVRRVLKMMSSRGRGKRQLLCKYVLANQSKSIQANHSVSQT